MMKIFIVDQPLIVKLIFLSELLIIINLLHYFTEDIILITVHVFRK